MLSPKCFLLTTFICILGTTQANASGDILRNTDGSIQCFNQFDASGSDIKGNKVYPDACEAAGKGHLATIRNLAEDGQATGAKGILEISQVNPAAPGH
jgi:hypothetical protein